jgi:hypothetical protein
MKRLDHIRAALEQELEAVVEGPRVPAATG